MHTLYNVRLHQTLTCIKICQNPGGVLVIHPLPLGITTSQLLNKKINSSLPRTAQSDF